MTMPAYARAGELFVIFQRVGILADEQVARDGADAMQIAVAMITSRLQLYDGDILTVRKVGDPPAELPQASSASQYSGAE
jgi:hypothetical protein